MHPAPSVILFTTFAGAGFGLLAFLGAGLPALTGLAAFMHFALAYVLATGGLFASAFHLGHPERALLAFTQWRTSWLSREAWAATVTLLVAAPLALGQIFGIPLPIGPAVTALAILTTVTTAMIYAQLRSVPRWHDWTTPVHFVTLSLAGGALLAGQALAAAPLLIIAGLLQLWVWHDGDTRFARAGTTLATATGLVHKDGPGQVRSFSPPHTGPNYLLTEMVYTVGRRRSAQLRLVALVMGFGLPLLLVLAQHPVTTGLAAVLHLTGVLASRWLFFAEAEHVVGLWYGARG
jgi:DMSO reductase anchor subunit